MSEEPMNESASDDEQAIEQTGAYLRSTMPPRAFSAGFADRAMARVAAERVAIPPDVLRFAAMQRSFRTLVAAAAVAIIALGAHNTVIVRADDSSLVEAALGLQPVSAESLLASSSDIFQ